MKEITGEKNILKRVAALIIRDKKLLLVTGYTEDGDILYWTPGGKVDGGESLEEALKREVKEELGVQLIDISLYFTYKATYESIELDYPSCEVYLYLANMVGAPDPREEVTDYLWVSRKDIESGKIPLFEEFRNKGIPKILKDNLI